MPNVARQYEADPAAPALPAAAAWSGDAQGRVGAMHRAIEERMLGGAELVAVLPLRPRPVEALARIASCVAGWGAVAACGAGVLLLLR